MPPRRTRSRANANANTNDAAPNSRQTIRACLEALGATPETWAGQPTVSEEYNAIRRLYLKTVVRVHPDRGGDAADFRKLQEAWEAIRELNDEGKVNPAGFSYYWAGAGATEQTTSTFTASATNARSWEWFAEAAEEAVPGYKVEPAKSARSQCQAKGSAVKHSDPYIPKAAVRCGSLDFEAGTYGRWTHLECWRVPASVWLGLPKPGSTTAEFEAALLSMGSVTFFGFAQLSPEQKAQVVAHCMDERNWAARRKKQEKPAPAPKAGRRGAKKAKVDEEEEEDVTGEAAAAEPPARPAVPRTIAGSYQPPASRLPDMEPNRFANLAYVPDSEPPGFKPDPYVKSESKPFIKAESYNVVNQYLQYGMRIPPDPTTSYSAAPSSSALVVSQTQVQGYQSYSQPVYSQAVVPRPAVPSSALVRSSNSLVLPRPGLNGTPGAFAGQTFVLTGLFPEVGGGTGLELGKARVKEFIESFGGRVTSAVSGKTTYLVVGKEPGYRKVSDAENKNVPRIDVLALKQAAENPTFLLESAQAPEITEWSSGYRGNGLGGLIGAAPTSYAARQIEHGGFAAKPKKKAAGGRKRKAAYDERLLLSLEA